MFDKHVISRLLMSLILRKFDSVSCSLKMNRVHSIGIH
jgi:hypothetical protein